MEPAPAPDAPTAEARPRRQGWRLLVRHQAASLAATAVDFGTMIATHELFGASAPLATAFGASAGAATNFTINRFWTFDTAASGRMAHQAGRYVLVSAASALLNVLGEWLLHDVAGAPYVAARACVAFLVSLAWNYPLQRWFVFRDAREPPASTER